MKDNTINKVQVHKEFPGFDEGDVLILNKDTGLFEFSHNDSPIAYGHLSQDDTNTAVDSVFNAIAKHKPTLSKENIVRYMNYFYDISEYEMRDKQWVLDRVEQLKTFIRDLEIDEKNEVLPESVNAKESKTVWQNVIWEYETLLGMRKLVA